MPIRITRNGFWYQDLTAVNLFLEAYLGRSVGAVFVDFEYDGDGQKSFDVRLAGRGGASKNYEIKTGDRFKTSPALIAGAFGDIIKARQEGHITTESQGCVLISPDFEAQIAEYNTHLRYIRSHGSTTPRTRAALAAFMAALPGLCADDQELYNHLTQLEVISGHNGEKANGERLCPLEHVIIGQIRRLAERIGINSPNSPLFPEEVLLNQLVYAAYAGAGTNEDLLPEFRRLLVEFYARYDLATPGVIPGSAGSGGTISLSQQSIAQRLTEFEEPDADTSIATTTTTTTTPSNIGAEAPSE